jgi:hypothetical protein
MLKKIVACALLSAVTLGLGTGGLIFSGSKAVADCCHPGGKP